MCLSFVGSIVLCFVWQVLGKVRELFGDFRWGKCINSNLNRLEVLCLVFFK